MTERQGLLLRGKTCLATLLVAAAFAGCSEQGPAGPGEKLAPPVGLAISEPVGSGETGGSLPESATWLIYVSADPGTFPDGVSATVANAANGAVVVVGIVDGGFDPVAIAGSSGDEIQITVFYGDGTSRSYGGTAPERKRPRVVRTRPAKDAVDVPLNRSIVVVFSEPIASGTITPRSIALQLDGAPVAATLTLDDRALLVELAPEELLEPSATYTLAITTDILDLTGDALEEPVTLSFTTGTTTTARVFAQVSAGDNHTCGVTMDNVAYCWGFNFYGQLGIGSTSKTPIPTPVAGGLSFAQVSAGSERTCGVATDGAAYCWGWNLDGELGDGTIEDRHAPTPVVGDVTFAQVSAGRAMVGSLMGGVATDGVAYCWPGCWGVGFEPTPVDGGLTFVQVSAGAEHECGITTDGAAYCWGGNFHGEFGDGTIDDMGPRPGETAVAGDLIFAQLSAGSNYTCGVTTDNVAYCWGWGGGRLGDGTTDSRLTPTPVAGDLRFAQLSAGEIHTCGVTTDHVAYCWGSNDKGQLGDGTTDWRLTPTRVAGDLRFAQVSAGGSHTCGLTTDHVVYCWGFNFSGQLGTRLGFNTMENRLTPTRVEF